MTRIVATIAAVVWIGCACADAHQLDEYLQATRIGAARDRVIVDISLTPGVAIAARVFEAIDANGDHQLSAAEIDDYARRVLRGMTLSIDDRPLELTLTRAECPSWDEMREGLGTIRIEAQTRGGTSDAGPHRIRFVNAHEPARSVYLVNALVPTDPAVAIAAQRRDELQRGIDIDVTVARSFPAAMWVILALTAGAAYRAYPNGTRRRLARAARG